MSKVLDESMKLNSNMNRSDLYVDSKNSDAILKDIIKHLDSMSDLLISLSDDLKKMAYKKITKVNTVSLEKKCLSIAKMLKKERETLELRYGDDKNNYAVQLLDDRITLLERKLSKFVDIK